MIVIDQILIIRIRMYRLDMPGDNPKLVVHCFQGWHYCVSGARRSRNNVVGRLDQVAVDARHNIFKLAFSRGSQNNFASAFTLQMPRKPCFVTPHTGVVDDNRIVNTVLCVINGIRGVRINDLDLIAIGDKGLALVIDAYRTLKRPVYRITAQQACTLFKIVGRFTFTHHNGSQSQTIATISLINQNPGQKATNAAKTIQHNVLRLGQRLASGPYQRVQFPV